MSESTPDGVLILYTGGTIGSLRKDRGDPLSPLEPAPLEEVLAHFPDYDAAGHRMPIGTRMIRLGTASFEPPLDSSDIEPGDWIRMARIIEENYDAYEGFVILHGTDTLAYTASALAFILGNLAKPVVVTGSQRPIGEVRSDAEQNLVTAVEIAAARSLGQTVVPEVCVFFRDVLLRGCRTTKLSARSYNAFGSPNLEPVGRAGDTLRIDPALLRPAGNGPLRLEQRFESNLASLDLFPGMPATLLRQVLSLPGLKGIVLRTFGSGNAPSSPELLAAVADATARGILVVGATQCPEGMVELGRYTASASLLARGVVSSLDMTREAALTKLFVVLGKITSPEEAADWMQIDLRGEQTQSVFNLHYEPGRLESGEVRRFLPRRPMTGHGRLVPDAIERALLRFTGLWLEGVSEGRIRFEAGVGIAGEEPAAGSSTEGARDWSAAGGEEAVFVPVTEAARAGLERAAELELTLANRSGHPLVWSKLNLACFAEI